MDTVGLNSIQKDVQCPSFSRRQDSFLIGKEGDLVANFIKNHLCSAFEGFKRELDQGQMIEFLNQAFSSLSHQLNESGIDTYMSGTTVVMAIIWENQVCVANVGDSKAYSIEYTPGTNELVGYQKTM